MKRTPLEQAFSDLVKMIREHTKDTTKPAHRDYAISLVRQACLAAGAAEAAERDPNYEEEERRREKEDQE